MTAVQLAQQTAAVERAAATPALGGAAAVPEDGGVVGALTRDRRARRDRRIAIEIGLVVEPGRSDRNRTGEKEVER